MLTITEDEVVYKLGPEVEIAETGTEDSSDTAVPEPPPASPPPKVRKPTSPPPRQEAGASQEVPWRDIDLLTFEFPEAPFKRVRDELMELQNQYFRMEHITRGVNRALDNCGPGNILQELAKRTDRKQVETLETKKAQLVAQVAAMIQELAQKSEEIRKYQAEQVVVLSRVRELVGHPGEVVNKAHLYDQLMKSTDPSSARQTLKILVKYSRSMKDLLNEIQKLLPPNGTPRRMLYPGPPRSPTGTLYEVIGEVELVPSSQAGAGPSQPTGTSKPPESGRIPDREKTPVPERTRSSQVRRKSTERSARSGRGQSLNPNRGRTLERSRIPERAQTPEMMRTLDWGKAPISQVSPTPALDCMIVEQWAPPPSHAMSARDPRTT